MTKELLLATTSIFVALDVIGTVPLYLNQTGHLKGAAKKRIVRTSMTVAFVVAFLFMFFGKTVFKHLGITLFDFKIAGGIVLLLIALADLLGGPEAKNQTSGETGIVPLAVPLITGPAVLTSLVLLVNSYGYPITLAAMVLNYLFAWVVLQNCQYISKLLGKDGTMVLSKIAALLLAAISVSMIRSGIFEAIKS